MALSHYEPHERVTVNFEGDTPHTKSRTKQEPAEETDINVLIKTWVKNGAQLPPIDPSYYGDFTQHAPDYYTGILQVQQAQEAFDGLPADTRAHFDHDPGKLLAFVLDENNKDEAVELGLIAKPVPVPHAKPESETEPAPGEETPPAGGE